MLDNWSPVHRELLTASILSGTSLRFIRDHLAEKGTGVPILPEKEYLAVRSNKWRALNRQLKRFQVDFSSSSSGSTKRPGALSTTYEVVPKTFKFSNIVQLKAGSKEELPVFTSQHYQRQFLKPDASKSLLKNMSRSKAKGRSGRTRQSLTPPRSVNADSVDDVASTLSKMGLSIKDQRNAKYAVVDPNDPKYQDVVMVTDGISNPWDIDARLLHDVPTESKNHMMQAFKLTIPVHGTLLNAGLVNTKFRLVVTEDDRKAVEMESPVCFERYNIDADMIEMDSEAAFGKHEGREVALKTTTSEKVAAKPKDGPLIRYTLILLPDDIEREETADEEEVEDGDGGTVSFVLFSNCEYSHHRGKAPEDGRLKAAFTLEPGNADENYFEFGSLKVPFPTAYFTIQIALDGTQERIGQFGGEESPEKLDADKWMTARAARARDKKDARAAAMGV